MDIVFTTNLDNYKKDCFPKNIPFVPRVGEQVSVKDSFLGFLDSCGFFSEKNKIISQLCNFFRFLLVII